MGAIEVCRDGDLGALMHIVANGEAVGIKGYLVPLVVARINQRQKTRVQVEKHDVPGEHKCAPRSGKHGDLAGDVLSSAVGLEVNRDQCARNKISRGRFLTLAENRGWGRNVQLNG